MKLPTIKLKSKCLIVPLMFLIYLIIIMTTLLMIKIIRQRRYNNLKILKVNIKIRLFTANL